MTALTKVVIEDTLAEVQVHYLSREISKWWNARRAPGETATFCGWFWVRNNQEGGPFRTRSAALRDAYYKFVIHQKLPLMWKEEIPVSVAKRAAATERRKRAALEARAAS